MISETQPLTGKRLVVTRSTDQAGKLRKRLESEGAKVLELPLIQTSPEYDPKVAKRIFSELGQFDWILFTSANGVRYFFKLFYEVYEDLRSIGLSHIAVVGMATAQAVRAERLKVDVVPEKATAESLATALMEAADIDNTRILVIVGNRNRDTLVKRLERAAAIVDTLQVYRTDLTDLSKHPSASEFRRKGADAIIFASSSAVQSFKDQAAFLQLDEDAHKPLSCSIGPQTSEALRESGISVDLESPEPNLDALVNTLKKKLSS